MTTVLPESRSACVRSVPNEVRGEDPVAAFERERPRLRRLAYRMLGSFAEAEDVVQDAWIRWRSVNPDEVRSASALLYRIVTRLCLDVAKSARVRRETYVGTWLPEPLADTDPEPVEDMSLPLMLALERLSPAERAAFLLHDVFDAPMVEVAAALGKTPAAVRQLAVRARRRVRDASPRYRPDREAGDRLADAFFQASRSGDVLALGRLLAEDVVLRADGGGRVQAFPNPIFGAPRLMRLYQGLERKSRKEPSERLTPVWIDGLPGYVSRERGGVLQTTALSLEQGRITAIYVVRNPQKLVQVARKLAISL